MVQRVSTVAFEGIEARAVDVQVQVAPGIPAFNVVGLPDKAVSEARERVRAALVASGLARGSRGQADCTGAIPWDQSRSNELEAERVGSQTQKMRQPA
jgi:Subunit ChlI of Mg-chelatase